MNASYVGRIAPAPTGALHLGNARTFLIAWLRVRLAGGKLILRLEDLDHPKVKPQAALDVYRDLAWLGLDWDAGPADSFPPFHTDAGSPCDSYVQSCRQDYYADVFETLRREGRVYPCSCTRKDLDSLQSAPNAGEDLMERRYPGRCRGRYADAGTAVAECGREPGWRFRVENDKTSRFLDGFQGQQESVLSEWSGDFLVARGSQVGYQLAVVADDHAMGVTEVVRGDDLLPSTHRQLALYEALGWAPPAFFHVPLVVGQDRRRLAKRHGDTRLSLLRQAGRGPERVLGWLAYSCGWRESSTETTLDEIAAACEFSRLPKTRAMPGPEEIRCMGWGRND